MNWHDGRQNHCGSLRYGYRSLGARYLGKGVRNNFSGGRERRCCFESIFVVVAAVVVMMVGEVDPANAGHTVVRCMKRQTKATTYPEIIDVGMEAMEVVVGVVIVGIPISPGGRAEVRGTGPIVWPLGTDVSINPPIVAAVIP